MLSIRSLAVAAVLLCGGSFAAGRGCRPAPVAVHDTVADTAHQIAASTTQTTQATDTRAKTVTRVITRTVVVKPDGTKIERDRTATTGERTETKAATVSQATAATVTDTTHSAEKTTTPVRLDPSWRFALSLEWSTANLNLRPLGRAEGEARLAGPFWAFASIAPPVLGQTLDVRFGLRLVAEW